MKHCAIDLHSNNSLVSVVDEEDHVVAEKRLAVHLTLTQRRVAPVELATASDLSDGELDSMLAGLPEANLIRRVEAGNECFWELGVPNTTCDAANGICTMRHD